MDKKKKFYYHRNKNTNKPQQNQTEGNLEQVNVEAVEKEAEPIELKEVAEQSTRKIRRRGLVIYYKQEDALELDDYIHVVFRSKRFKYIVVYLDEKKVYETKKKLINSKGIKDIVDCKFDLETFELNV